MDNDGFDDVSASKQSEVWRHFLYDRSRQVGKCNVCRKILKATCGNTKGLKDHLKVHNIAIQSVDSSAPPAKKSKPITNFFDAKKRITLETKVSRICSLSCVSFKVLPQDTDIREALSYQGYNLPKCSHN